MRFLIIFIFFISNVFANEIPNIKNIVINKQPKTYGNITFLDSKEKLIKLTDYNGYLVMLNFWATWCTPCKKEIPSLDILKENANLDNLEIFPINVGKDNVKNSKIFFDDLNIKNLDIYFDDNNNLARDLSLRGIPTTVLFNKEGKEFARIIGYIDFNSNEFLKWLSDYN